MATKVTPGFDVDVERFVRKIENHVDAEEFSNANVRHSVETVEKTRSRKFAYRMVDHLIELGMDSVTTMVGLWFHAYNEKEVRLDAIEQPEVRRLLQALERLTPADAVASSSARFQLHRARKQLDNVQRMVVALIDDPRVAILKLTERVVRLEFADVLPALEQTRVADEVLKFYCPLASRLGIWQLKWKLEDFSFHIVHPDEYRWIASQLDGRRAERERQVAAVREDLLWRLEREGIKADLQARAKHIYGIWRKMRAKGIALEDVYDAEAVRVIVNSVAECYAVLGVVHTSWPHISAEFDDYIANPKANGYSSLHTAVIGPRGHLLEVQIRTREMHEISELGVCAHFAYKGDDGEGLRTEKVDWLREVIHWHDELHTDEYSDLTKRGAGANRIYVTTPKGHVVDLPDGATAIDFAYQIHTEVGHRCVGARVDSKPIQLNVPLKTGQLVEVLTEDAASPSRSWLDLGLGYVTTHSAKEKIQSYFRLQSKQSNIDAGCSWIEEEIERLGLSVSPQEVASSHGYKSPEELYLEVALGNTVARDVLLYNRRDHEEPRLVLGHATDVSLAKSLQTFTVFADDRPGLLRDVCDPLANMNLNVVNAVIEVAESGATAKIQVQVHVNSLVEAARVIDRLRRIDKVLKVTRGDT